jgi:hypothetical protein
VRLHACDPSYSGGVNRRTEVPRSALEKIQDSVGEKKKLKQKGLRARFK